MAAVHKTHLRSQAETCRCRYGNGIYPCSGSRDILSDRDFPYRKACVNIRYFRICRRSEKDLRPFPRIGKIRHGDTRSCNSCISGCGDTMTGDRLELVCLWIRFPAPSYIYLVNLDILTRESRDGNDAVLAGITWETPLSAVTDSVKSRTMIFPKFFMTAVIGLCGWPMPEGVLKYTKFRMKGQKKRKDPKIFPLSSVLCDVPDYSAGEIAPIGHASAHVPQSTQRFGSIL